MSERNIQKRRQPEEKHQPKTGVSPKEKPLPNTVVQGKYQPKTGVSPKERTKGTGCFVLDKAAKLTYLENEGDRLFRSLLLGADAVRVALFLELP